MVYLPLLLLFVMSAYANNCSQVLEPLGLKNTGAQAAHGSHSLTLNMIQYFFNPDATKDNGIPTVNLNRSEKNDLHENAQYITLKNSFYNPAFFALDNILSNMDHEEYGIMNANTLDRLAHDLHMIHIWEGAALYYQELLAFPPNPDICSCFLSTYLDDIKAHLEFIAKEIRIPNELAATYNMKESSKERAHYGGIYYAGIVYLGIYAGVISPQQLEAADVGRSGGKINQEQKLDLYSSNIVDEKTWDNWKELMKEPEDNSMMENMNKNLALYLYCKL